MLADFRSIYQKYMGLRFLIIGALNTLFGYTVFSCFTLLGAHYVLTVFLSILAGMLFNFYTYGSWVFHTKNARLLPRFILANLLIWGINTASLSFMIAHEINIYIAQMIVIFPLAIFTYLLSKNFVFRESLLR